MSQAMPGIRKSLVMTALCILAACNQEPPPRTVHDFLEDPILLEATMVRCAQNRSETKYEADCVSAKLAANRLVAAEEQARKKELEEQSERKRDALRRAQEARAEALRRAAEAERLRREAEYLGIFDEAREPDGTLADGVDALPPNGVTSNAPTAQTEGLTPQINSVPRQSEVDPSAGAAGGDLDAIREELRRRQEDEEQ